MTNVDTTKLKDEDKPSFLYDLMKHCSVAHLPVFFYMLDNEVFIAELQTITDSQIKELRGIIDYVFGLYCKN